MADDELPPGTRVYIWADAIAVRFRSRCGVVVRKDTWDNFYIIHLDEPATFRNADGTTEPLSEIVQSADNFLVISGGVMTDDDLIARHIEPDATWPGRADEARITGVGIHLWAIIGEFRLADSDAETTATSYDLTAEQMAAALAYYARHRAVIDARLTLNEADFR